MSYAVTVVESPMLNGAALLTLKLVGFFWRAPDA